MGEGAARAITIGSIVLTILSLAVAMIFARKRSRIRLGFDLARAVIGVAAILVMAAVTGVATPGAAIALAIAVGLGLGFAQGSSLEISSGERGFYSKRSPVAIALWGVGIVVMQAAGLAARTGTVRVGQTIAWFSACLGIGLMVGRGGPVRRAAATAGIAGLLTVALPVALVLGAETGAVAQSELAAEDLCAFAPYQTLDLDAGEGLADPQADLGPATVDGVKFCARTFGGYIENGQRYNADVVSVYLYPSTAAATAAFDETANELAFTMLDIGIGDRYMEIGVLGDLDFLAMGQRGPFIFQIYSWFEVIPAREAMREIDVNVAPFANDTGAAASTTIAPGDGETTTTIDSQPATGTTEATTGAGPESGASTDEPIDPEEAAGQAIAGLIAAAAIGLISWAEAAAEIGRILDGLHGAGGPLPPTHTRTTVVISGADAEAIISGGPGSSVPIPVEQQTDLTAGFTGEDGHVVEEGPIGSVGIVRSVGAITRGPDGSVSVSVEVDAFDPPPPPPPPPPPEWIELDPITGPEPDIWPSMPRRPPPLDPNDDTLTPEDLRDEDFREWLDDQRAFGEKVAGWHEEQATMMDWLHLGGRVIYTGADQSIHILANFTGPTGKLVKDGWNVAKHTARATGRSLVDGEWRDNVGRSSLEWFADTMWSKGFDKLVGIKGFDERIGIKLPEGDGLAGVPLHPGTLPSIARDYGGLLDAGLKRFGVTRGAKIFPRNWAKDLTGVFDWSPPWPDL